MAVSARRACLVAVMVTVSAMFGPAVVPRPVGAAAAQPPPVPDPTQPAFAVDHPDPDVVLAHDGLYYSYSTATVGFGRIRVPVAVSPDLRTWELQADALPAPGAWADPDGPFWAPSVARLGDRYVLYYTATDTRIAQQCVGVAVADGPLGPFVDASPEPLRCAHDGTDAVIDPSVFVGADGKVVLHYKTTGRTSRQIWAQPLDPGGTALAGDPVHLLAADQAWERQGIENPEMFDFGGVLTARLLGQRLAGGQLRDGPGPL